MTSKPEDLLYQNLIRSGIVRITVAPKTGWEPSQFGIKTSVPALQRGFQESAVTSASVVLDAANACSLAVTQWKTCHLNSNFNPSLQTHRSLGSLFPIVPRRN